MLTFNDYYLSKKSKYIDVWHEIGDTRIDECSMELKFLVFLPEWRDQQIDLILG